MIERGFMPPHYLPESVESSRFDPDVMRARAEAHCRHRFDHGMEVKAWTIRYLLDVYEAALEASGWHMSQGAKHITDVKLWEALTGREHRAQEDRLPGYTDEYGSPLPSTWKGPDAYF